MRFDSSSHPRLRVRDVWSRPGLAVVRLGGEIDLMSVPVLAAHLHALASEHKQPRVILDLAEVTILEAHAITLLVHVACDDIDIALYLHQPAGKQASETLDRSHPSRQPDSHHDLDESGLEHLE